MANTWIELGDVWSGRDLVEGERVTVSVFDASSQTVVEQTTFVPKAGRLEQMTWVMDLCEQVNATLKMIRAGVQVGDKLEIQASGYLNKFWGITAREVKVVTTTARSHNWSTEKRVSLGLAEDVKVGSILQLKVHNTKGQLLETVSFKSRPGRSTRGLCTKDFASEINNTSLYVRAGTRSEHLIEPNWETDDSWIWIPYNADFKVSWALDQSSGWTELDEVWSGRDLAEGERVTVSVFDKTTQAVLEQTTFVPKAGRLGQMTWVMDLCEQVNAQLKLVHAADEDNGEWLIRDSGYRNKFWSTTPRDVQVITTTARQDNWPTAKRVELCVAEDVLPGSTLQLKVHNAKDQLLETVTFRPTPGRSTRGLCTKDFAIAINNTSLYVRAGSRSEHLIEPTWERWDSWIWIPFNADFKVSWTLDQSSGWTDLGEVWSGRDLAEGERVTVSVFDKAAQTVLEQTTFVPKAGRLEQMTWVMDLCEQVNAQLKLIAAGVKTGDKLETQASGYLNKFWGITTRDVQVITTAARSNNWTTDKRVCIDLNEDVKIGSVLQLKVHNAKGQLLETVSFKSRPDRSTLGLCAKDFATEINNTSLYVRAGVKDGSRIDPGWEKAQNWIWIPFNADFKVSWTLDQSSAWTELGDVWSGRDLAEGERVTVSVFDKAAQTVLEQTTFVPKAGRLGQMIWVTDLCEQVNAQLKLVCAGVQLAGEKLEIQNSGYLNKYWSVTARDVQVITTTARAENWTTDKRVQIDLSEDLKVGSILQLKVHNAKGQLLETVSFKSRPGRSSIGLCAKDFASEINNTSLYVRAGQKSAQLIEPMWEHGYNWIWIPFNADFKVSWSIDQSSAWTELGEVWSGRDLAEGERITVSVFDKATQTVLEQINFVPKAGRLGQMAWVTDLCEQVNAEAKLIRTGDAENGEWVIRESGYRNKFWGVTQRDVQVVTTTARTNNWTTDKRVNIDLPEKVLARATLHMKVHNGKGELLEALSFKVAAGRDTAGLCARDFATRINSSSLYVRAGAKSESLIEPSGESGKNWIWIPFNADFKVSCELDLSSALTELDEVWSGRDLAEGERVTVSVFDKASQRLLEQITFVPRAGRLEQMTWVMDLCEQVNAGMQLIRAGVLAGGKLEILSSGYRNKFWSTTEQDVQVITTTARTNNWPVEKRVSIGLVEDLKDGSVLKLKVRNSKGQLLETVSFTSKPGRSTRGLCTKDFSTEINNTSLYVRAGAKNGSLIEPTWETGKSWIWIPFNADFKVSWTLDEEDDLPEAGGGGWSNDLLNHLTELGEVWSGRDLLDGEKVTVNVFDKALNTVLEQITFEPLPGCTDQYLWVEDFCQHINNHSALIRAGVAGDEGWEVLQSGYQNKYWSVASRELVVVTTVPHKNNWSTGRRERLFADTALPAGTVYRLDVRSKNGASLEVLSFTPGTKRLAGAQWAKDLCDHINSNSLFLRAGTQSDHSITPIEHVNQNYIWRPANVDLEIIYSIPWLKDAGKILADRDAVEGERVTCFVFDDVADRLLEQITLTTKSGRLKKEQWPADLARQINASSSHAKSTSTPEDSASSNGISHLLPDLRTFTTALHLDNWGEACKLEATADLTAGQHITVMVTTAKNGNFCEATTFIPDPARLKAAQWACDLARHLNQHSLYLKAGLKDSVKKTIEPAENARTNVIWMPGGSGLKVSWSIGALKEIGSISLERDLAATERCMVYVLDDSTEQILREFDFVPNAGRTSISLAPKDLAVRINDSAQLIVAGERKANERPDPLASKYLNKLWACTDNVRGFTTLHSPANWDKGDLIGSRDLAVDEKVTIIVKGKTTGRIFESFLFVPKFGRESQVHWTEDCAQQINEQSRFIRGGEEDSTKFMMVPVAKANANRFWTPKNSGLLVECVVTADLPRPYPGMGNDAKALFDQWDARKYISVDVKTGQAKLQIPVAELFADDSFSHPYKVGLSYTVTAGVHLQVGGANNIRAPWKFEERAKVLLTLVDGRQVKVSDKNKWLNCGDFIVEAIPAGTEDNFPRETNLSDKYNVIHKSGVVEKFYDASGELPEYSPKRYRTVLWQSHYDAPSGRSLAFQYSDSSLNQIIREGESAALIKADMWKVNPADPAYDLLKALTLFPDSGSEKMVYDLSLPGVDQYVFEVDGFYTAGKIRYTITKDGSGRLVSIQVEKQHEFTADKKTETDKSTYRETLEYDSKGRVSRHMISPGEGVDEVVHEYHYATDSTTFTGYFSKASPRTAVLRRHSFVNGQSLRELHGCENAIGHTYNSHTLDTDNKCLVSHNRTWAGGVLVDEKSLITDANGCPLQRNENGQVSYLTYFNNYQQFRVTESEVRVQDWSFFGTVFKALDYLTPHGLCFIGGKGGLTWGTRIDTTVEMVPANNDYAKKAFNLPVDIKHCGSEKPLYGDVESELVCSKVDGKEQAVRLTFFGYAKVDGRVRMTQKLTILQPDVVRVDVTAEQLKVATAAAQAFIDSLKKQIGKTSGDEKKGYQQTLADLEKSLDAQSKVNGEGFKLNSWKAASMSLETFEYHTDAAAAGHGTVKSVKTVQLGADGKELAGSARTTGFSYAYVKDNAGLVTITTTVSRPGETDIVSSQTRSRNTGRLYENVDTAGVKTAYSYDRQGNLVSETVSKDGTEQRKSTCTLGRKLIVSSDLVEDGSTTRMVRDALGRKIEASAELGGTFLVTDTWAYDSIGRVNEHCAMDYGKYKDKDNKEHDHYKIATRKTTWSWDELTGARTAVHSLTDAAGKETTVAQVVTPSRHGERFTQGDFTLDRQFDAAGTTYLQQYFTKGVGGSKIERSLSADGQLKAVRYLALDASGEPTEHDRIDYEYDAYGQLSKAKPKLGAESTYTYDATGRLRTTTCNGVTLENDFGAGPAQVAVESRVKQGTSSLKLGSQKVDLLGRVASREVNGTKTELSYSGASTKASLKTAGAAPPALADYSSSIDKSTRTYTQTLGKDKEARSSTLVFTTGGRVRTFTDLTGTVTTYEYDFFNRVVASSNDQCVCTFTYADNGLLSSESIKALNGGNLTMQVSYRYDPLGQEISRTFTCEGVETLILERTLLADGRLSKSTRKSVKTVSGKVTEKELHSDSYEYDESLRLKKWTDSEHSDGTITVFNTWTYDALGNITRMTDTNSGFSAGFDYEDSKPGQVKLYKSQMLDDFTIAASAVTHDSAGRLTDSGKRMLSYHANGQANTHSTDADKTKYTFSYDSEGRVRGGSIGKLTDTYHYRGDSVYALVEGDESKSQGFAKRTLVLRNESRACLMQDAITDDTTSRSFELRDANGSIIASVDLATKAITHFRYEPYGKCFEGGKPTTWLGFKGEPLNRMGLYHLGNGYRLYDPGWGRFLSWDSWSPFDAGGVAGYVFGRGDPVNYHDPSGHQVIAQYSRWEAQPAIQSTAFRIVIGAVGVLIAPFTAGMSVLLAVATTALAAISFSFDVASIIIADSDPELAKTLEAWGQVFGIAGAAAGVAMTLHGLKELPKLSSLFKVRGGLPTRYPVKFVKTPRELMSAQKLRNQALDQLAANIDKAKAAGVYEAVKPGFVGAHASTASAAGLSDTFGMPVPAQLGQTLKSQFIGIVRQADDALLDALGNVLDAQTGPVTLIQKFQPTQDGETAFISIAAGPIPGREKLSP